MKSVFKVGTYIVPLQNKLLSRHEPLTAYKPYMITKYSNVPYILSDGGEINFCDYHGKEVTEREVGIRWFETLKEAQVFCNHHIFEVGKYYSFNWDWLSENSTIIAKVEEIDNTSIVVSWRNYLWVDGPSKYSKSDGYNFTEISQIKPLSLKEVQQYLEDGNPDRLSDIIPVAGKWYKCYFFETQIEYIIKYPEDENWECCNNIEDGKYYPCGSFEGKLDIMEEIPISEIQQYLPENHPDKVKIPEIPEYIVIVKNKRDYNGEPNFCYRRIEHKNNSPLHFYFEKGNNIPLTKCSWRPATEEEIRNYPGKPYDVTTIPQEFILPEKWQIKVTPENREILAEWRTARWLSSEGYCVNKVKTFDHVGYWFPEKQENYTEITFEQFKKYVLKESVSEQKKKNLWLNELNVQEVNACITTEKLEAFCRDMFIPKKPEQNKEDKELLHYLPEPD